MFLVLFMEWYLRKNRRSQMLCVIYHYELWQTTTLQGRKSCRWLWTPKLRNCHLQTFLLASPGIRDMSQKLKSHLSRLRCQKTCSRRRGSPAKKCRRPFQRWKILVKKKTKVGECFLRNYYVIQTFIFIFNRNFYFGRSNGEISTVQWLWA